MPEKYNLISWNVNGLRAAVKKGFLDLLLEHRFDVVCIQETKASQDKLPREVKNIPGYYNYFVSAEQNGYSGVGTFSKKKPLNIEKGMGSEIFDREGRFLRTDYEDFVLMNIYFPNGKASQERLDYKMAFYDAFLDYANALNAEGKKLVICGDVNTAHKEIDLARPKQNETISGFLPEEREWMDKFLAAGYLDTFRMFNNESGNYSWWSMRTQARERNVGWRLDYFFVSENLREYVNSALIYPEITGSDHCPVGLELEF
ncbi:Exodeoxyribonuclease III [Methanosarcina horonobensis HB-1 = JCM 15518]|uniref:Exodeoxyribonuclease III n=1 Tax=Methanosarcina horonobensis HB-1 = JCM 15518 TaxID=1434110 RepID=A0A0E3WTI4_9EURY|nr:exodeoxyribonuclease III [Methanosarcina horonobensis]AKB77920.1 Exodeoxyribonuclease III [Methanosarcina horonobensis HB-1 = JCM 15518]